MSLSVSSALACAMQLVVNLLEIPLAISLLFLVLRFCRFFGEQRSPQSDGDIYEIM